LALILFAAAPAGAAEPPTTSGRSEPRTAPDPGDDSTPVAPPAPYEAPAATVTRAKPKRDRGEFLVAVKLGGLFAQAFSRLGASYLVDLELGYALPVPKHPLALPLACPF